MCGIAGIAGRKDETLIRHMTDVLVHRGPDSGGFHVSPGVSLGHRRLSIIDIASGSQPMSYAEERYWIVFNGEIYNYRELRGELAAKGCAFATHSDTEVILASYAVWGEDCVNRFLGMFAFGIWDAREQSLFLARDAVGIKPLYYAESSGVLYFGSEIKALKGCPNIDISLDWEALDDYLTFLYAMPPRTFYQGIRQLPPGHTASWKDGRLSVRRYWKLFEHTLGAEERAENEWEEILSEAIRASVKRHLIADVPVGSFLSAGLDSCTIAYFMAHEGAKPETFTLGFDEEGSQYDEREPARAVAKLFGTNHHESVAKPDIEGAVDTVLNGFDEPFGNPTAILTHALSAVVRRDMKVILSGDGGDECFGGYPRYAGVGLLEKAQALPLALRRFAGWTTQSLPEKHDGRFFSRRLREFCDGLSRSPIEAYTRWISIFTPEQRGRLYNAGIKAKISDRDSGEPIRKLALESGAANPVDAVMYADVHTFLANNVLQYGDRMSMAHGLEVRVPFADRKVVEISHSIPVEMRISSMKTKCLLRRTMAGRLPEFVIQGKKRGFEPPMGVWLTGPLNPLVNDFLSHPSVQKRGWFDPEFVSETVAAHMSGHRDHTFHIWSLLLLEAWARKQSKL